MSASGPNLFIVGAPKCGTTAWYRYLKDHPDIFFPSYKEPNYFLDEYPHWGRLASFDEYLALYSGARAIPVRGDASPHYLYSERAAQNIHKFNADAKIIILVRDQADFFESLLNQHIYSGVEAIADPRLAWDLSGERRRENMLPDIGHPEMLDYKRLGRFDEQIERYFSLFAAENIRVFHLRDWSRDPRAVYLAVLELLGLPDNGRTEFGRINEAHQHRFSKIADFVRRPPPSVGRVVRVLRQLSGRRGLGAGEFLLRLNRRRGPLTTLDDELRAEIREYYLNSNEKLESRLWRPRTATCAKSA